MSETFLVHCSFKEKILSNGLS